MHLIACPCGALVFSINPSTDLSLLLSCIFPFLCVSMLCMTLYLKVWFCACFTVAKCLYSCDLVGCHGGGCYRDWWCAAGRCRLSCVIHLLLFTCFYGSFLPVMTYFFLPYCHIIVLSRCVCCMYVLPNTCCPVSPYITFYHSTGIVCTLYSI